MYLFFFFNDTATTEIYTLSLHDALPIWAILEQVWNSEPNAGSRTIDTHVKRLRQKLDRKSTRLNSSHGYISYAVFCLKKKKITHIHNHATANISLHLRHKLYDT